MPNPPRPLSVAVAAVAAATLLGASPAAFARGSHHAAPPKARAFNAHGVVVSHTASTVTVLARQVRIGNHVRQNQRLTVHVATRRHAAVPANGTVVTMTGTVGGRTGTTFTARTMSEHRTETHVYLGTIQAINGSMVTIAKAAEPSDDPTEDGDGAFTVDTSTANIVVDGAAGDLAVGQSVALLGTGDDDAIVATDVYAFSALPSVEAGIVTDVTGTVVTLTDELGSTTPVDLASVPMVVDGTAGATPDLITVGACAVVLGSTDGNGTFTPAIAFVFNTHDGDGPGHDARHH